MKKEDKTLLYAGGIGAFIASLCCLGPVIIVLLGLGSISTALTIGTYSWLFTSLAIIFFVLAITLYLKKKKCCNVNGMQRHWKIIIGGFIILVILLIVLKYWFAPLLAEVIYK